MLVALGVIIADSRLGRSVKSVLIWIRRQSFLLCFQCSSELLDGVSQTLASRDQLELENRALRQELLLKTANC
ncbi:hypothetical protein ACNKHR_16100 [Shigella flexneri]